MIPVILFLCASTAFGQAWTPVDPQSIIVTGRRDITPQECITYHMDYVKMKTLLWGAPYEYTQPPTTSNTIIMIGLADGTMDLFRIVQYDMMEAPLAAQYTDIKTFRGVSISNPYRTIRADWTVNGFRAVISDLEGKTYIDPFQRNDMAHRIVYRANTYLKETDWSCGIAEESLHGGDQYEQRVVGDCAFRSYRLAVATTGEYSNFFGATSPSQSALVLAQVVTAINRVNDVYEADFTVRLLLVDNTDDVFYYDPGGDPYTNGDGGAMLGENQETLDGIIGNSNYDIGHVFSTGGGGVAFLGAICDNMIKAGGVTGSSNPVGDPYIIDYIAHEMGHQFGASHTFNGTAGSCGGGNRSAQSAYEPGSGSTIMAYAGICGLQNIQPNSDDYFHARSLLQITNKLSSTSCAGFISFNNDAPNAANVPNYTIPISTPFVLTASATDPNNDPLSYCWEQYDLEGTSTEPPAPNDADGPMFRSFSPASIPQRYFPRLQDLIQNISPTWEVLPSVSRSMVFKATIRDYHQIAGCTDEDNVTVTTNSNAGPFVITSQNSPTSWLEGDSVTITWNVANTTASPVSCPNVDIFLSLDGGMTYPVTLDTNEPNDGSAMVIIPAGITSTGRVMVKASNNIFFDINNANITILQNLPNFTIQLNPKTVSECNDGSVQTIVEVGQFLNFSDPVSLSLINKPPGSTVSFNPTMVNPGSNSILTISNLAGLFGTYTPIVRASSSTGIKDSVFTIILLSQPTTAPTLISPGNNSTDAVITPILDWQTQAGATQYEYQLAYDNMFVNLVVSGITAPDMFHVTSPLIIAQQYYWRVRGINSCGTGAWSSVFNFTTTSCFALMSADVPVPIPSSGTPTVYSDFSCPIEMVISDVNVINLMGSHSWVDDLRFTLIAPDGSERIIWDRPCDSHDNFNIQFDDEAANNSWPCPPTNGLTYKPDNLLSFFDGKQAEGLWQLKVQDLVNSDGGSLTSWGLKVCGDLGCQLTVNQTVGAGNGTLAAAIACADAGDTIRLAGLLSGQTINIGSAPLLLDKNLVILAEGSGINITGSGVRVFEIVNTVQVELLGMKIIAGTSMTGGAIYNPGTVKLKNVTVEGNPGVSGAILIDNTPGAQLFVDGNCILQQ